MNKNIPPAATASGMHGNLYQWLSMKRCLSLICELEKEAGHFDWIIWARPDLFYFSTLEYLSRLPLDALYFPTHDNWGGLNDRFCMGSAQMVKQRLGIFDYFVEKWYPQFHARGIWNPEMVLHDFVSEELKDQDKTDSSCFWKIASESCDSALLGFEFQIQSGKYRELVESSDKNKTQVVFDAIKTVSERTVEGFPFGCDSRSFFEKRRRVRGTRYSERVTASSESNERSLQTGVQLPRPRLRNDALKRSAEGDTTFNKLSDGAG